MSGLMSTNGTRWLRAWWPKRYLQRRFLPGEILARARPSGVSRIVLVQMSCYQTDNRYMLDVIASAPETFRGIAVIDARSPEGEMRRLASLGVRGFRIGRDGRGRETWPETAGYDRLFRCSAEDALAVCPLIDP